MQMAARAREGGEGCKVGMLGMIMRGASWTHHASLQHGFMMQACITALHR
jgi:hypothetical protein